jgi:hypothetical protein
MPEAAKDQVGTPPEPVKALVTVLRYLHGPGPMKFSEPCAGAYTLAAHLERAGLICAEAYDIAPRSAFVTIGDATQLVPDYLAISNPPYSRKLAEPILRAARDWPHPSWWLVPAGWLVNEWCGAFQPHIDQIVPVGRVSWVRNPDGSPTGSGFEDSVWIRIIRDRPLVIFPRLPKDRRA